MLLPTWALVPVSYIHEVDSLLLSGSSILSVADGRDKGATCANVPGCGGI